MIQNCTLEETSLHFVVTKIQNQVKWQIVESMEKLLSAWEHVAS
jgi:hypothetical protein